jgi:Xaa-Pro aminopeptidase
MSTLTREKLQQAKHLVKQAEVDVWLTFVRETAESADPILPFLMEGSLTWQSALMVFASGRTVAVVGKYDDDPLVNSGDWDKVIPYVQSIKEPLLEQLHAHIPHTTAPRIAVNFSTDDVKADGLTHGMFLLLKQYLAETRFENALVSSEEILRNLRGIKSPTELDAIRHAVQATQQIFDRMPQFAVPARTEREIWQAVQAFIDSSGWGYGWDRLQNPIINCGPESSVGHGMPSDTLTLQPGHIFHIDVGVVTQGYSSDLQRCWYLPKPGETDTPQPVQHAARAVWEAILAGFQALQPGVPGWEVDAACRRSITASGYPEYMHAAGHQVGRMAHDGGAVLAPRWQRYGRTPYIPIQAGEIYTLELGVDVPGYGGVSLEEMALVTDTGAEWLSKPQTEMWTLQPQTPANHTDANSEER